MGNLRNQLLKAKLVKPQEVKKADREAREQRRESLIKGRDQRDVEREQRFQEKLQQQQIEDRIRAQHQRNQSQTEDVTQRINDLLATGKIVAHGQRRFFFVLKNGLIPFMDLDDSVAKQLERGQAAIIEIPNEPLPSFIVVDQRTAKSMGELAPERICLFNTFNP